MHVEALTRHRMVAPDPKALFAALDGAVLFETGDATRSGARRSILVTHVAVRLEVRGPRARLAAVSAQGRAVLASVAEQLRARVVESTPTTLELDFPRVEVEDDEARLRASTPLDALRALVRGKVTGEPGPFAMFAAVLCSYDLVDVLEVLPAPAEDRHDLPDLVALLAEGSVVIDSGAGTTKLFATAFGADAVHDAARRLQRLEAALDEVSETAVVPPAAAPVDMKVDLDDAAFGRLVGKMKQHIVAGDVFQIVASRTFSAPCPDPRDAYARLARSNPSPYQFYFRDGDAVVFGASPEASVRVSRKDDGQLQLELHPIAGTRRRGASADEDDRIEAELRLSDKEVAEHMMLVDLARNDIARVAIPGTRRVTRLLATERYSHVMHLVSEVAGTLRPGLDALHAYAACANMGTLVGAPKLRAAEILRENELDKRGIYGGAIGWLSHDGTFDSAIVIRSAFVKDGVAHVRAGAGVVDGSDPAGETDETSRKARAVLSALGVRA